MNDSITLTAFKIFPGSNSYEESENSKNLR